MTRLPARLLSLSSRILLLLCFTVPSACTPEKTEGPPNIVILFADDLGYGDLSCYGHPSIRTPRLDSLADEGIRLTSFYVAAPACTPSRAALLTGRYPQRVGLPTVLGPDSEQGLAAEEVTLAEALKEQGYRTKAVGKWHLGHLSPEYLPTAQGFDSYLGLPYSNDMIPPWVQTERPLYLYRDAEPAEVVRDQTTLTKQYTEEAVNFIRETSGEPFFLYLAYSMPHVPISTFEEMRGRSAAGLYGDVIETIDWSVGQVLDALDSQGLNPNTIVVFSSDNGPWLRMPERMFQEDIVKPWHAGSAGPLRGAKASTYEGGMRVPAIIRWPGRIQAKTTSSEMVHSMDLYPTLVHAAGGEPAEGRTLDGRDLFHFLQGGAPPARQPFFYMRNRLLEAVRVGPWKFRLSNHWKENVAEDSLPEPELFNLNVDPSELYNLAEQNPEKARELAGVMLEFAAEVEALVPPNLAELARAP